MSNLEHIFGPNYLHAYREKQTHSYLTSIGLGSKFVLGKNCMILGQSHEISKMTLWLALHQLLDIWGSSEYIYYHVMTNHDKQLLHKLAHFVLLA